MPSGVEDVALGNYQHKTETEFALSVSCNSIGFGQWQCSNCACLKRRKASPIDAWVLTPEEKKQIIRDLIRIPQPWGDNLVYFVAEAVDVVRVFVCQKDKKNGHSPQFYLDTIKQKTIDDVWVPVQQSQLNRILVSAKERKTLLKYWNQRGEQEIVLLVDLRPKFDNHAKWDENCWTLEQTNNVLINQTTDKLTIVKLRHSLIAVR
jgi:hypothetical protein